MVIYKITNKLNGKVYIGQTTSKPEIRWAHHISSAKRPKYPIARALHKYGHYNFEFEVICYAFSREALNELEIYFIKFYNSLKPLGYNLAGGGAKPEVHPDTGKKISVANSGINHPAYGKRGKDCPIYGIKRSEESKKRYAESKTGAKNPQFGRKGPLAPNYGRKWSAESIKKMSQARKLYYMNKRKQNE